MPKSRLMSEDLLECINGIIQDYPRVFVIDDLFATDQIRVRRRGPSQDDFKPEDVVGTYLDTDFTAGKISEETIRRDIQSWLQKRGKTV